ncbi:hypothetical protein QQ045_025162 [Rhodiola kirilowii]
MEISKFSDSSLIDFVGIDDVNNNATPIPTDPIALFAFVCKFTASKLEEVEAAVKRRKEEFSRPKLVSISARQSLNEVAADHAAQKKKKELKSSSKRKTSGSFAPQVIKDEQESSRKRNNISRVIKDKPESSRKRKNISRVIKDKPESSRKRRKKPKPPANTGPESPPDLPDNYKRLVKNVGGEDPALFLQKRLFATDLEKNNNRLSIPVNAIRKKDYLTDEEKALLETRDNDNHTVPTEAKLWDPKEIKWTINLRKWDMKGKEKPKAMKMYNLSKPWYVIVENNTWKIGDLIQL